MADHIMAMSEAEISAVREALSAQQELLQKLHNELDAEREASATAASEALSMILRLQGEKAGVKMEAEQYKRLAEERMCHTEESFAIIEEIIYEREMEVAALDYQVQSYRYKLLSMGWVDPDGRDIKNHENLLQRNRTPAGDRKLHSIGRRNSAPNLVKKYLIDSQSSSLEMDLNSNVLEEPAGDEAKLASDWAKEDDGGIDSYPEQIRKLNMRVKAMAGANCAGSRNGTRSPRLPPSRLSVENLCHLNNSSDVQDESQCPSPKLSHGSANDSNKVAIVDEIEQTVDHHSSLSVHDVFEVPQADYNCSPCELSTKGKNTVGSQAGVTCGGRDYDHLESTKLYEREEHDWLKKLFQSTHNEQHLCRPSDIAAIDRAVVKPTTRNAESEPSSNPINGTSAPSEVGKLAESDISEEELKLLKEIKEKLNVIHHEIRSQREKSSMIRKQCLLFPEAMLHFWL